MRILSLRKALICIDDCDENVKGSTMTKEERRTLLRRWKFKRRKKYILNREEADCLLDYIDEHVVNCGCDGTLKFALEWLEAKYDGDENIIAEIIEELNEDGGYCDCEVVMNCYERYDLD